MKDLTKMGDEELLIELDTFVKDRFALLRFKIEVHKRIGLLTEEISGAINKLIANAEEIDRKDIDLPHQPQWMRDLGNKCAELRAQLLPHMKDKAGALCAMV